MTNDSKHLFMSSSAIWTSSSVKCLFKYFAHFFFNWDFCLCDVFLLHFESFLCILDSSSLSQVVFTILFPLPFYINFRIIHTRKKFNGILNGIGLNLLLTGKNGHFNNIESSFFFFWSI